MPQNILRRFARDLMRIDHYALAESARRLGCDRYGIERLTRLGRLHGETCAGFVWFKKTEVEKLGAQLAKESTSTLTEGGSSAKETSS